MKINSEYKEAEYFVEIRPHINHLHPVHKEGCPLMPGPEKLISLGFFKDGNNAVFEGLKYFPCVKGCLYCIRDKPDWSKGETGWSLIAEKN